MRLCHLKNKLITPHHFLQDHCYCCLPISMPKELAVAVLLFFHFCYTKGSWFPLPLIKIVWFHTTISLFLFYYHVFLWMTHCFSFTVSARTLPCENKVADPDQIQQLFFIEPSFQGHTLNTSDQRWTLLVKTWKILAALSPTIQAPSPQPDQLRLFIFLILHSCKLHSLNKEDIGFSCNSHILRLYGQLHHFCINKGKNILLSYLVKHDWIEKDYQIFSLQILLTFHQRATELPKYWKTNFPTFPKQTMFWMSFPNCYEDSF